MVHETIYYLPLLAKTSIVQSTVYGVLMFFVLNKHITIFTDNDMYHANVATLDNRSPIVNEHINNSFIIPDYPARSPFYVLSYVICCSLLFYWWFKYNVFNRLANQRSFIFRISYSIWVLYNISDKSC